MKKIILTYNLIITSLFLVTGLINAKASNETAFSFLFLPIILYFGRQLLSRTPKAALLSSNNLLPWTDVHSLPTSPRSVSKNPSNLNSYGEVIDPEELTDQQVSDLNKRLFLKLIGTAGLTAFTFSLFTKKSHAAFFGSIPGPGTVAVKDTAGNQIDPAEKQPTDGYEIAEVDDNSTPAYYGFLDKDGNWYIAREAAAGNFRYIAGSSNFSTSWSNRAALSYQYFNDVF